MASSTHNDWNTLYGVCRGCHAVDRMTDTVFFSDLLPARCPELYRSLDKILSERNIDHRLLTNTRYSDKQEMERRSRLQLPDFKVVSCKETKPDFGGNYMGQMEIAFCEDFSPETLNKIKTEHSKNKIVFKSVSDDVYGDWWHLQLSPDLKTAVIHYGHIDPMCP